MQGRDAVAMKENTRPIEGVMDSQINVVKELLDAVERLASKISPILGPDRSDTRAVDPGPSPSGELYSTLYRAISENNETLRDIIVRLHSLSERVEV